MTTPLEEDADYQVNLIFARIGKALIIKECAMQLLKGSDGKVYRASESSEVTRDNLVSNLDKAKELVAVTEAALGEFDSLVAPEAPSEPEAPQNAPEESTDTIVEEITAIAFETPIEDSAEATPEAPIETPVETAVETPTEAPVDAPIEPDSNVTEIPVIQ